MRYNPEIETHVSIRMSLQTALEMILEDKSVLIDYYLESEDIPYEMKESILSGETEVEFTPILDVESLSIYVFNEFLESQEDEDVHYLCKNMFEVLKGELYLIDVQFVEAGDFETLTLREKTRKLGEVIALSVAIEKVDESLVKEIAESSQMIDRVEEMLMTVNADRDIFEYYTIEDTTVSLESIKYHSSPYEIAECYTGYLADGLTIEQILTDDPIAKLYHDGHLKYTLCFKFKKNSSHEYDDEYDEEYDEE